MLFAVSTFLICRRPAFFEQTVTQPPVRLAGLELRADHLVWATGNRAWTCAAAVFGTETFANRGGGATCHRARLEISTAVFHTMFRS